MNRLATSWTRMFRPGRPTMVEVIRGQGSEALHGAERSDPIQSANGDGAQPGR